MVLQFCKKQAQPRICGAAPALINSDLFDVNDVGITGFSVGISSGDDDLISIFGKAEFHSGAFCVVKKDVDGIKFFGHDRDDTPRESKFTVGLRFNGHSDNIDLRAESGNESCRAAGTRANDDGFCSDIFCKHACGM